MDPDLKDELKEYMKSMKESSMNQVHNFSKEGFNNFSSHSKGDEMLVKYEDFPSEYVSPPNRNPREASN